MVKIEVHPIDFWLGAFAGQDDLLRFAETATQQSIKSAMMEMHSSVPSPGARMKDLQKNISEQLTMGSVILGQICDVMAFVSFAGDICLTTLNRFLLEGAGSREQSRTANGKAA